VHNEFREQLLEIAAVVSEFPKEVRAVVAAELTKQLCDEWRAGKHHLRPMFEIAKGSTAKARKTGAG
jgi:hypothetical protein